LNAEAHTLEHVAESLHGEDGLLFVAGAGETDHEAVADELIVADAFDGSQVFQAGEVRSRGNRFIVGGDGWAD